MRTETDSIIELPKVELHIHLEGSIPALELSRLAAEAKAPLPRPVERLFEFGGFDDFLDFLTWSVGLIRSPEQARRVARDFAAFQSRHGIVYTECIVNPVHWAAHWKPWDLFPELAAGFEAAAREGLCDCVLLPSLLRQQSRREALDLVHWMATERPPRVVGLSVDGNESKGGPSGRVFAPAYDAAREAGFGTTAHTGESAGWEGVEDSLEWLRMDRIDHGVRACENPATLERLVQGRIPCNVCISSNCIHLFESPAVHPFRRMMEAGVPVTINTDDPAYIGIDLPGELRLAADLGRWDAAELRRSQVRAIDASFCDEAKKEGLRKRLEL